MQPTVTDLRLVPLGVDGKRCSLGMVLMDADKTIAALDGYIREGVQQKLRELSSASAEQKIYEHCTAESSDVYF